MADVVWFMQNIFPWLVLAAILLLLFFGPSPRKKNDVSKQEGVQE